MDTINPLKVYHNECRNKLSEIGDQAISERAAWMERILFFSATLFGILISFHSNVDAVLNVRICFAAVCVSLALGILFLGIASYDHVARTSKLWGDYLVELQKARKEGRRMKPFVSIIHGRYSVCAKLAYFFLGTAILLLAVYSVLIVVL